MNRVMRATGSVFAMALCLVAATASVAAASASISKAYKTDTDIPAGSLVSLSSIKPGFVETANTKNQQELLGVATSGDGSLLAVDKATGGVQIVLSGVTNVLVSNLNGDIRVGDQIGVSPLEGVGIKAAAGTRVIGIAQSEFNDKTQGAVMRQIKDNNGHQHSVAVGYISVAIAVSTFVDNSTNNNVAHRLADFVAGHQVSNTAVILSSVIALLALISVASLIYGAIRGSVMSIGRNPLARPAIFESLAQVMAMSALVVVMAVISIYFLLRY